MRYRGPVLDAHQHFWEPQRNDHPWLRPGARIPFRYGDYEAIKRPYLPDDLRRDAGPRLVGSVYVETEWNPADPLGETDYAAGLAVRHGLPTAIVAQAWLDRADAGALLAAQAARPLVRSVRHKPGMPDSAGRTLMSDPAWRRGFAALAPNGLVFDLQTAWTTFDEAEALAADFPGIPIVLNHLGLPGPRDDAAGLAGWAAALRRLAARPNVFIKLSGIGVRGAPWTAAANDWIVRTAVDLFGADRSMFGSNFPVDSLCATYGEILEGFGAILEPLPEAEQAAIFDGTARRAYRLGPGTAREPG